jgi:hypothetical protein
MEYVMDGAFASVDAWVKSGKAPPRTPWIALKTVPDSPFPLPELDQYGNALGGLRLPYVDVPIATYYASSTAGDEKNRFVCSLLGYKAVFDKDRLAGLYPTHQAYVAQVARSTDALVSSGFITAADGRKIKEEATQAAVPYKIALHNPFSITTI